MKRRLEVSMQRKNGSPFEWFAVQLGDGNGRFFLIPHLYTCITKITISPAMRH
jgi:hypothetical protein